MSKLSTSNRSKMSVVPCHFCKLGSNTFSLQFSHTPDFATFTKWSAGNDWRQAGSANGAEEFERRYRVPTDAPRYARVRCVVAGTANQTGKPFEFAIVT